MCHGVTPEFYDERFVRVLGRAEAKVTRQLAAEVYQTCSHCSVSLPISFYSKGVRKCRTCVSDYDRCRYAAAPHREPPAQHRCTRCSQLLPAVDFDTVRTNPSGLSSSCKRCNNKAQAAERALNAAVPRPAVSLPPTKVCSACRKALPRASFHQKASKWDGLQNECKTCNNDRSLKAYRAGKCGGS